MEQSHLHGKQREFRRGNNLPKTKENDVRTILFSLAYLTLIKLPSSTHRHRPTLWTVLQANIAED